ncbi:hypothetical protein [Faecalimicrobium sp. JNUCC 81]
MNKKIFSLLAVGAITTSMLSGVVASAAEGSKDINVTYNNQTVIVDPDNPGAPEWQVAIPSGINFTEDKKTADVGIELQNPDGTEYSGATINVDVSVASKNGYELKKGASTVGYKVAYGSKTMAKGTAKELITTLSDTVKAQDGQARLSDDVATVLGTHTDTLTYTVEKQ